MKKFIQLKLKILAKMILAKYKPDIIGITGSVGKTSAREAIFAVLSPYFRARRGIKNYNNEIGVPLTIIGAEAAGKSIRGWFKVFWRAVKLIILRDEDYPKILIIELGVDRPGDMRYLTGVVKCKVGVVTKIGESHLEFFQGIDDIANEKWLLLSNLTPNGFAVLNFDDERIKKMTLPAGVRALTYGLYSGADLKAEEVMMLTPKEFIGADVEKSGLTFKLTFKDKNIEIALRHSIGEPIIEAALAAAAVGVVYGLNLAQIREGLLNFKPPLGRMNLVAGIKNTLIIDDTYNSSPQSSLAALEAASKIKIKTWARRFAVLGDMLELGSFTEEGHRLVGRKAAESGMNELIVVGEKARDIGRGAREAGMKEESIFYFPNFDSAKLFVQEKIKEGDLILVKGSQGARMEKVIKEIMAEPLKAKELLVRQEREWE